MKVLIVDDSKVMRTILIRGLQQAGLGEHIIEEAGNGKAAMDKFNASEPDIVISDWSMPEMSGIELLRNIRALGKSTPVVFVTSEATTIVRELAEKEGAQSVISKPFTADVFRSVL